MSTIEFNALNLKGAEQIKITLHEGTVLDAILLNGIVSNNMIFVYNLKKKNKKENPEEYIALNTILEIEII